MIHTHRDRRGTYGSVQTRGVGTVNFKQWLIICSQVDKHVWELKQVMSYICSICGKLYCRTHVNIHIIHIHMQYTCGFADPRRWLHFRGEYCGIIISEIHHEDSGNEVLQSLSHQDVMCNSKHTFRPKGFL